jgi:hypothetical protein
MIQASGKRQKDTQQNNINTDALCWRVILKLTFLSVSIQNVVLLNVVAASSNGHDCDNDAKQTFLFKKLSGEFSPIFLSLKQKLILLENLANVR